MQLSATFFVTKKDCSLRCIAWLLFSGRSLSLVYWLLPTVRFSWTNMMMITSSLSPVPQIPKNNQWIWKERWSHTLPCQLLFPVPTSLHLKIPFIKPNSLCKWEMQVVDGIPARHLWPSVIISWWQANCTCLELTVILTLHKWLLCSKIDHH